MRIRFALCVLTSILLFCCQDKNEPVPVNLKAASTTSRVGYLGEASEAIAVRVTTQNGYPVKDVAVTFTIVEGHGTLQEEQSTTDDNGVGVTYVRFTGTATEEVVVEASVASISGTLAFTFNVSPSHASKIVIDSGNDQEGVGGDRLEALSVLVSDDYDNAAAGVSVSFVVIEGNGQLENAVAKTNSEGFAAAYFKLGTSTSINRVAAIVGTDSALFTEYTILPTVIESVSRSQKSITIRWTKTRSARFDHYSVLRYDHAFSSESYSTLADLTDMEATTFEDKDVLPGRTYTYKIRVQSPGKTGVDSEPSSAMSFSPSVAFSSLINDIEVDDVRNQLYVSLPGENAIAVIDLATRQVKEKIVIGSIPARISLSHDNNTLYVALSGSGEVAFLNLDSKAIATVDIESALGDVRAFDVVEAGPGRVFVTGNPQSTGLTYVVLIKMDEGNRVERCSFDIIRTNPILAADYGKTLYLASQEGFYTFDMNGSRTDSRTLPTTKFMAVSPDGSHLYLSTSVRNTTTYAVEHTFDFGIPTLSRDGTIIHYLDGWTLKSYSTASYAVTNQFSCDIRECQFLLTSADNSTFYATARDFTQSYVYFLDVP